MPQIGEWNCLSGRNLLRGDNLCRHPRPRSSGEFTGNDRPGEGRQGNVVLCTLERITEAPFEVYLLLREKRPGSGKKGNRWKTVSQSGGKCQKEMEREKRKSSGQDIFPAGTFDFAIGYEISFPLEWNALDQTKMFQCIPDAIPVDRSGDIGGFIQNFRGTIAHGHAVFDVGQHRQIVGAIAENIAIFQKNSPDVRSSDRSQYLWNRILVQIQHIRKELSYPTGYIGNAFPQ